MDYYDLTIIVPIYNAALYLNQCIDSLLNQHTNLNYCIFLINDGSLDHSLDICNSYKKQYQNIYVFNQENKGTSTAKNLGLNNANSKYIMFVDSDDYVDENYISSLLNDEEYYDLYCAGYSIVYEKQGTIINNLPPKCTKKNKDISKLLETFKSEGILNVDVSKVYLLEIINKYQIRFPTDMSTGEDLVFNCNYFLHTNSFKVLDESHYFYIRRDVESLVNSYKPTLFKMVEKCLNAIDNLYDNNINKTNICYLANVHFDYRFTELTNLFRQQCDLSNNDKLKIIKEILNNEKLNKYLDISTRNDKLSNIFKWSIKQKKPLLTLLIYKALFFLRYRLSHLYFYFRNKLFLIEKE